MDMMKTLSLILILCLAPSGGRASDPPAKYAIKGGKILTMRWTGEDGGDIEVINQGIILVSDGKIEAIGPAGTIKVPSGYRIIDASDRWVTPGVVEAHTHIAAEGGDLNDMVTPLNPELCVAACVDPEHIGLKKALAGGVTTVHTMPGSGTNLGGFTVIIKTYGSTPEEMILREPGAMKMTQAYNPERRGGDLGLTRMGMSWMIRHVLQKGKAYADAWKAWELHRDTERPERRPELENMRKAFDGLIPTIVHTYDGWGVMQTVRMIGGEYGLKVIPTHTAFSGHLIADKVATRENVHINIGPRLLDFYTRESNMVQSARANRFYGMGAQYRRGGVRNLSINTDAVGWSQWGISQEELPLQAAMSARLGLDDFAALQAITINPARALGIDDRVGSLEVGKDADIVIKRGSLLDVAVPVDAVLVNGRIAYERPGGRLVGKRDPNDLPGGVQ
jgi:imidazolonepropionase-like amidohydrolase